MSFSLDNVLAHKERRTDPKAEFFTDHKLLTCKHSFAVKTKKKIGTKPHSKLDTTMNVNRKEKLRGFYMSNWKEL